MQTPIRATSGSQDDTNQGTLSDCGRAVIGHRIRFAMDSGYTGPMGGAGKTVEAARKVEADENEEGGTRLSRKSPLRVDRRKSPISNLQRWLVGRGLARAHFRT
jgi:hypothetical protein